MAARLVEPSRLGELGENTFSGAYAKSAGFIVMSRCADGTRAELPAVVEAWADPDPDGSHATFMVNGTPCITHADAFFITKTKTTVVVGPEFKLSLKTGKNGVWLHVNIMIPFIPMTSDGKEPELGSVVELLRVRHREGCQTAPDVSNPGTTSSPI